MIKIILGNVGSGKTAGVVRYMKNNPHLKFITNIDTYGEGFKNVLKLKAEMIIKKTIIKEKRDGTPIYKYELNKEFWIDLIKKIDNVNIIIDEAHIFFNPRRSMSKLNVIMTDFLALLRRVLGSSDASGELILITQLSRRLDIISKEMSTDVSYSVCHYKKGCKDCGAFWIENNEQPDRKKLCPVCNGYDLKKFEYKIEVYEFQNIDYFQRWWEYKTKSYYKHYFINDIENYFGNYDTLQFSDMMSEFLE